MIKWFKIFFIFVPISILVRFIDGTSDWNFIISALAIIPLASLIAKSTDELSKHLGPSLGGLINVTFGNATELIISILAILKGLLRVVKATIAGSIITNLLLVLGLSLFFGGIKYQRQRFNQLMAVTNATMLMLAIVGMIIPAIFYYVSPNIKTLVLGRFSLGVGASLFITYLASLYFTQVTHRKFCINTQKKERIEWGLARCILTLLISTVLIAFEGEQLVGAIDHVEAHLGISGVFIGVIIIPLISNVAENTTAVLMARKGKIDLSLNMVMGSSIQVALFIVPLLIFFSHLVGKPMNVLFSPFELSAIGFGVLTANTIYLQGQSNWFEGFQLIAAYIIIALAFFFAYL
ncbi:calcium/proton exchanger [Anoxybacter fermentans]|uniref:Ca(2+)/H(+) antiporter n=1 Tax=Anoxybacter fermentans TaxID=1323375 RepID=A0A3S9T241_9FIRM|nr:calcium/proton exchanger [Anoxybacter fermentans]AZR74522.1 calcium/proton exchanger [Anoxybacter fermentans]